MHTNFFTKATCWLPVILVFAVVSMFLACQKEASSEGAAVVNQLPDLSAQVSSSVSGFVTDENNNAVNGASVKMGTATTSTNRYGYFEIKNVQVIKNAAMVTVSKPGYFNGIKTYIGEANKTAFFRIKLIPKIIAGTINASTGGNITLSNGLVVSLPAAAVVTASTMTAYSGTVNVAAHWINPAATDLTITMPGDLRGLDSLGLLKGLTTYGMVAVELTGTGGELLQIAGGKKATLTIPLPLSFAAAAPTIIPLWYFDESLGLWKQQGNAIKTGNTYVAEVSHFSFWNCDVPSSYVRFTCTVVNNAGQPVQNVLVKVSVLNNPYNAGYGYTDSAGFTGGAVPDNAQLKLEVFTDMSCGTAVYAQNFSTSSLNVELGNIVVPNTNFATVSGTVIDCGGAAVTNGYVMMAKDGVSFHYPISNTGTFSFTTSLCSGNSTVTLIAEDLVGLQGGSPVTAVLSAGSNVIAAPLSACGTTIDRFVNYTINGTAYSIIPSATQLNQTVALQSNPTAIIISAYADSGTISGNLATVLFYQQGIAAGSAQPMVSFNTRQINDSLSLSTPAVVNITEYGPIGQFIAGNFSTTFIGAAPANTPYNVTLSFRVRRTQ